MMWPTDPTRNANLQKAKKKKVLSMYTKIEDKNAGTALFYIPGSNHDFPQKKITYIKYFF